MSKRFPHLPPARRQIYEDAKFVRNVCLVQAALMICLTIYFVSSAQGAAATYHALAPLKDFVPIVRRLYSVLQQADINPTLHRGFAIYIGFAVIQIACVLLLAFRLWPRIVFRRAGDKPQLDKSQLAKSQLGLLLGVMIFLIINLFVFVGDFDMANTTRKYANRLASDDYFMSFVYCLLVPTMNFLLCLVLLGRYERLTAEAISPAGE
jgi:hypothetical protein